MKKICFILALAFASYGCTKTCGQCFVVEYESNGTTVKSETSLGDYCGSDAKQQAQDKALADGISCNRCQVQCR